MLQPWMIPADLAPGDQKSMDRDWSLLTLHRVESPEHPLFDLAFNRLWEEFGGRHEMETREVVAERMKWVGQRVKSGTSFKYRMFVITSGDELVAIRDHTAILPWHSDTCVVHLSHALVEKPWRRTGIAGWLRALPVTTARNLAALHGVDHLSVTLAGEMEPWDAGDPGRVARLTAYEKAGYQKIDPKAVAYLQPDFRSPDEIDASGGPRPIPLHLIIRRVGKETEASMPGKECRQLVEDLYEMYSQKFRSEDMEAARSWIKSIPKGGVALLPPTSP